MTAWYETRSLLVAMSNRKRTRPLEVRFWEKVDRRGDDECWPWLSSRDRYGYGKIRSQGNGPKILAHRVAYELAVGPIPEGLTLDHLCRNRSCVNPAHLEPVTNRENVLRGEGITAQNARKTHCKHGHPFDEENTYWHGTDRHCKECQRKRQSDPEVLLARRQKRAAAKAALPKPPSQSRTHFGDDDLGTGTGRDDGFGRADTPSTSGVAPFSPEVAPDQLSLPLPGGVFKSERAA